MCKKLLNILIVSLICINATAQKNKINFQSINSLGLIGGESKVSTAFQTVNGIRFSNWFSGIGIGVDFYRYRSLPLFFDARRYFGTEKKIFVYGDLGYNFRMKDKPGKGIYYTSYHFIGGIYSDFGIGYQVPSYKKTSFIFSLGYSYKKLESKIGATTCPLIGPCYVDYSTYYFRYSRMILKAGLVF